MKITEGHVLALLERNRLVYKIPIYQRKYSWDKKACERLFEDIVAVAENNKRKKHFIGSVIYLTDPDTYNQASISINNVIDGQQRLTTLSLLILALADYTKETQTEEEYKENETTTLEALGEDYLFNKRCTDDYKYKINLTSEDFSAYKKLCESQSRPDVADIKDTRIYQNYYCFLSLMRKSNKSPYVIKTGINKLALADVSLVPDDDAQLVFDTVNSTGKKLSLADKIRNLVLMRLTEEKQNELYTNYWHKMELSFGLESDKDWERSFQFFVNYYVEALIQDKTNDNVYDILKGVYIGLSTSEIEEHIKEIYRFSEYYLQWCNSTEDSRGISKAMHNIKMFNQWKIVPSVLTILDNLKHGRINEDEALKMLNLLEAYIVRRQLCGLDSRSAGFTSILKGVSSYKSLLECIQNLTFKQRFPNDKELCDVLPTKSLYGDYDYLDKLLWRVEQHKNKDVKYIPKPENYSIEHIMPQTVISSEELYEKPNYSDFQKDKLDWAKDLGDNWSIIHDSYCNTIGNLTLTGYNSEYRNYRFIVKRDMQDLTNGKRFGYMYTPISISSTLSLCDKWGEDEIIARANEMISNIIDIWKCPEELNRVPASKSKDNKQDLDNKSSIDYSIQVVKAITLDDIKSGIISVPREIVNILSKKNQKHVLRIVINNEEDLQLSFTPGRGFISGVTDIFKKYGLLAYDNQLVEKNATWTIDSDETIHIQIK